MRGHCVLIPLWLGPSAGALRVQVVSLVHESRLVWSSIPGMYRYQIHAPRISAFSSWGPGLILAYACVVGRQMGSPAGPARTPILFREASPSHEPGLCPSMHACNPSAADVNTAWIVHKT